jgi:dTDP-4-amino-4,6-dideoxygalactose transaminase
MEKMNIPILDLRPELAEIGPEIMAAIEKVVYSGQFILGPEGKAFEEECAAYLGTKHAIGLNSGTDALIIGLRALGIGPGDEVITSPFSFFASAESISLVGATPVFVDVDPVSMNMDPSLLEAAITEKTKAIMPVHIFGNPAAITRVEQIAKKQNLKIIEDCAQSFGAKYQGVCEGCDGNCGWDIHKGKALGTIGDIGAFSFFPTKNLGAYGDAGLLITDNDELAELARKLRTHGSIKRYENEMLGYNSRLDSVQAAILRVKLKKIDEYNTARRGVAARYGKLLEGIEGVVPPAIAPGHIFHQYTIRVKNGLRDKVQAGLQERGVTTVVYYPIPQHLLPVYRGQFPSYPISESIALEVLSLPIWPQITEEQQAYVANAIREVLAS